MWYVIQVRTGMEHRIVSICRQSLMQFGEDIFVPTKTVRKRIRGSDQDVEAKLFPGYVFFDTEEIENLFGRLKTIKEMTNILKTGDEFVPLNEREETLLKKLTDKDYKVQLSLGYIEGDRVVITEGPMMGLEGLIKKINRHKKYAVLETEFFDNITEITVGLEIVDRK